MKIYPTKKLGEVLDYEQPTKYLVSSTDYKDEYPIPVLTAGKSFILGNTNEKSGIFPKEKLPVIIFDDFTTAIKFVNLQFKVKSSAIKILQAKKNIADISYIFYKMQTINFKPAQHKRYWISEYSHLKIPLPPLEIQKQIVERLDKIVAAQKLNDELIQKTDELFQSLLHKELNPAGKNWEVKKIGEVAKINYGKGLSKLERVKNGKYYAYGSNGPVYKTNKILVNKPTVVVGRKGAAGVLYLVNEPSWPIDTAFYLEADEAFLDLNFMFYALQTKNLPRLAIVTAVPGINRNDLSRVKLDIPPLKTQKQIATKLSAVQDYKIQLLAQKSKLKELFDSALAKSFK